MAADKQNLQDAFLNHVRKAKVPVTIFLINGVKHPNMAYEDLKVVLDAELAK